jgi:hypothetical protein
MCVPFLCVNVHYTNNLHCHFPSNLDEYDGQSLAGSEAGSYGPARLHDYQTFLHDLPCHTIRSQSQEIGACLVVRLATLQDSQTFLHDLTCHTLSVWYSLKPSSDQRFKKKRYEYHIKRYIHFIYYYYYYYTISEPGNRGLSRSKTGPTTRFGGAMLSTLYHSRLHVCLYLLNAEIPHSSCVARDMNYTK